MFFLYLPFSVCLCQFLNNLSFFSVCIDSHSFFVRFSFLYLRLKCIKSKNNVGGIYKKTRLVLDSSMEFHNKIKGSNCIECNFIRRHKDENCPQPQITYSSLSYSTQPNLTQPTLHLLLYTHTHTHTHIKVRYHSQVRAIP